MVTPGDAMTSPEGGGGEAGGDPDAARDVATPLPDGAMVLTDGAIVIVLPDGGVVPFDGAITPTDGGGAGDDGSTIGPDASDGAMSGPETGPDGALRDDGVLPFDGGLRDDGVARDDGVIVVDGTVILPDGARFDAPPFSPDAGGSGPDASAMVEGGTPPIDGGGGPREAGADVVIVPDAPVFTECMLGAMARRCTADSMCNMAAGERCLSAGCGADVRTCQPSGRACTDNRDCLAGLQTCNAGRCVATGSDCGDTRACPLGYLCEGAAGSRRCVDRRRTCLGSGMFACPTGASCYTDANTAPFCLPLVTRCETDAACLFGTRCVDANGDGQKECMPTGSCARGGMCPTGQTCTVLSVERFSSCNTTGLCASDANCPLGYTCVDPWGTGVKECRSLSDSCQLHSQCAGARQLCDGTPAAEYSLPPGCH